MDKSKEAAGGFLNEVRLTDAFAAEYVAAPGDNAIRENVEADGTFLDLNTSTVIRLPNLHQLIHILKQSELTHHELGLHPSGLEITDLGPNFSGEIYAEGFDGPINLRISSGTTRCF